MFEFKRLDKHDSQHIRMGDWVIIDRSVCMFVRVDNDSMMLIDIKEGNRYVSCTFRDDLKIKDFYLLMLNECQEVDVTGMEIIKKENIKMYLEECK